MDLFSDDDVKVVQDQAMEALIEVVNETKADLEDRKTFIGGSDAASILGVSPWKSRYELWMEKTGRKETDNLDEIERVMAGKLMEDPIARLYTWKFGTKLRKINERIQMNGAAFPAVAQIDRKVEGMRRIVEIKNTDFSMRKNWGEEGSSDIPIYYYTQVEHQLMCSGYDDAEAVPLFGGNTLLRFPIPRSEEFINALYEAELNFWEMVKSDTPPEPLDCEEAALAWGSPQAAKVSAEAIAAHLIGFINQRNQVIKAAELEIDMAKLLCMRMLENKGDTLTVGGKPVCTWKIETRNTFDADAFKKVHPEMFAFYTKKSTSRVFRLSKAGKETVPDHLMVAEAMKPIAALMTPTDDTEDAE